MTHIRDISAGCQSHFVATRWNIITNRSLRGETMLWLGSCAKSSRLPLRIWQRDIKVIVTTDLGICWRRDRETISRIFWNASYKGSVMIGSPLWLAARRLRQKLNYFGHVDHTNLISEKLCFYFVRLGWWWRDTRHEGRSCVRFRSQLEQLYCLLCYSASINLNLPLKWASLTIWLACIDHTPQTYIFASPSPIRLTYS